MSSSKNYSDPFYDGESPLTAIDEWSAAKRVVTGLQRRQLGLPTHLLQDEVLGPFDAADLEGKARMLGPIWQKWRHLFESPPSRDYFAPLYDGPAPITPVSNWAPEDKIASGLKCRWMGIPPQPFQCEALAPFDAADLAGKARMLGRHWPNWRHLSE